MADFSEDMQYVIGRLRNLEVALAITIRSLPPANRDLTVSRLQASLTNIKEHLTQRATQQGAMQDGFDDGHRDFLEFLINLTERLEH